MNEMNENKRKGGAEIFLRGVWPKWPKKKKRRRTANMRAWVPAKRSASERRMSVRKINAQRSGTRPNSELHHDFSMWSFELRCTQSSSSRALFQRYLHSFSGAWHRREAQLRRTFIAITPHTQRQFLPWSSDPARYVAWRASVVESISCARRWSGQTIKNLATLLTYFAF